MRRLSLALCLSAALALCACGTTVQGADTSTTSEGSALGAPVTEGSGLGQVPVGADPAAGGTPGAAPTGSGTAGTTGPGTAGSGDGTGDGTGSEVGADGGDDATPDGGGTASGSGRGVSDTTIKIGFPVESGGQEIADAFGVSGFSSVSREAIIKAIVADVNTSGGVLGRELEPVFHYIDSAQYLSNPALTVAEICADYGVDRPVFAVVISVPEPGARACLAEMGSPMMVASSTWPLEASTYAENGGNYLYGITSITTERQAELFIESLEERNFHEKWNTTTGAPGGLQETKLGVIHIDTDDANALYADYATELKKYGREFEASVTYANQADAAIAATTSAVLRFKTAGVTHVYGASAFFLQAAENQGYRPRYAYLPGMGTVGVANAPKAQLRGALTVGFLPARDVDRVQDPGDTPGAKRCRDAMAAGGLSTADRVDLIPMYNMCDGIYSLVESLEGGGAATVPALRQGFESLGQGFDPAFAFRADVGPGRHAGIDSVRDMAFDSACGCLKYTSSRDRS